MPESVERLEVPPSARATGRRNLFASLGGVGAAILASLCCIGPLVFVAFGVGAGLASTFEPLRPVFTALTIGLLAIAFYTVYGKRAAATAVGLKVDSVLLKVDSVLENARVPDESCDIPRNRRRDKVILWTATVLAILLLTFPQWSVIFV